MIDLTDRQAYRLFRYLRYPASAARDADTPTDLVKLGLVYRDSRGRGSITHAGRAALEARRQRLARRP